MTGYLAFLVYLFAIAYTTGGAELIVVGGSNSPYCINSSVTLKCTLSGDTLTWYTPRGVFNITRVGPAEYTDEVYDIQSEVLNPSDLRSTITFTITSQTTINCSITGDTNVLTATITTEGPPGAPERPLTSVERIERVDRASSSVSVVWEIPTANNAHISNYLVTVDPPISLPDDGVIAADNPLFNSRQLTLTLQHDQQYKIRVRANSCNDRVKGTTSDPLIIKVQIPPTVARCTVLPVYDYDSNNLTQIEVEWDPIPDSGDDITAAITASVQNYNISAVPIGIAVPAINDTVRAGDSDICSSTKCRYNFERTGEMFALYYSVYVTAKNILTDGYSESRLCSNTEIGTRNDRLALDVRGNFTDVVEVLCRPLSRYEGRASCQVVYSVLPDGDTYTEESDSVGGAEDTISVFLTNTEPGSDISVSVATRGGKQDIVVEGIFEIGEIVIPVESLKEYLCTELNETIAASQPSTTETSTVGEVERGTQEASCPVTPWILAGGIFIITLPTGLIAGITLMLFYNSKRKKPASNPQASIYEYISPRDIPLESNSCYTLSETPDLPKPRKKGL